MATIMNRTPTNPQVAVHLAFSSQVPAFSGSHQLQWQLCSIPSECLEWRSSLSAPEEGTLHPHHSL